MSWARIPCAAGVTASILMGLQLERWKTSVDDARVAAFAVFALATMPPLVLLPLLALTIELAMCKMAELYAELPQQKMSSCRVPV